MEKLRVNRLRDNVERKYRAKTYRVWKKGLILSILLLSCAMIFASENVQADVWQANSVETIKAKLKEKQNSYIFEEGDTFYNIGLAVNVKWQTLMELNGFAEGSQYTVPVGTTIKFDGSKVTVTDKDGNAVNEKELSEADKIDPSKPFGDQTPDTPQTSRATTPAKPNAATPEIATGNSSPATTNGEQAGNQANPPSDKAQAEKEKQAAEAERQQAERDKQAAEKERQETERLKQEAEQRLTEALNKENDETYAELQVKQAAATAKVTEAQTNLDGLSAQLAGVEQNIAAATVAQQAAQGALTTAQATITDATANQGNAQQRVNDVSGQISALQGQAGDDPSIQAQLEQLQQQLAAAQGELTTYGAQLASAQQAVTEAQANYNAAEGTLNTAVAEKAAIEAAMAQAQMTLVVAQQELANAPSPSTAMTSDAAKEIQAELAQYNDRIAALDIQINELANKIQALTDRIAVLDQVIQGAKNDVNAAETAGKQAEDSAAEVNKNVDKANETANDVENNLPRIPTNEDKHVTIRVDEAGNTLTDTTGYVKVSESQPVKSVETLPNGDTITTYTTTVTYHKVENVDKQVTVHVDEAGNVLSNLAGYFEIKRSEAVMSVETLPNGDTVTTYTTTVTYHKVVNTDKEVTVNLDEEGNTLTDTTGYVKVSESQPEKTIETLGNGDTITTYTTTVTYHKIANTDKQVIINVDESGNVLNSLAGYVKVKESEAVRSVETLPNGDTITVYTTTVTYHKIVNTDKEVIVNIDETGNVLSSVEGYIEIKRSERVKSVETLTNGDTITTYTTTVTYHKIVNTDKQVTKNIDEATGKELTDVTGYEKVSESQPVITVETLSNGDTITTHTTTVTYKKIPGKDPIIEAIKPATDAEIQAIKDQVVDGKTKVTVDQADKLVNAEFSKEVAKHFEKLVQEEQIKYNEKIVSNTKDEAAYRETAERAVEVMYSFSHTRPANSISGGTYVVEREVGTEEMSFFSENISHTYVNIAQVKGDSKVLAELIAQQMFNQYIVNEREAGRADDYTNGGHYINIIRSGHPYMALAVFIVEDDEFPGNYKVATTVKTGYVSIVK